MYHVCQEPHIFPLQAWKVIICVWTHTLLLPIAYSHAWDSVELDQGLQVEKNPHSSVLWTCEPTDTCRVAWSLKWHFPLYAKECRWGSNFTVYSLCRGERTWLRDTCSDNCYTVYKLVQKSSMDKVAMSMMGGQGLLQNWTCLAVKMAHCHTLSVEPATLAQVQTVLCVCVCWLAR